MDEWVASKNFEILVCVFITYYKAVCGGGGGQ